jgi:hypothetical protein
VILNVTLFLSDRNDTQKSSTADPETPERVGFELFQRLFDYNARA